MRKFGHMQTPVSPETLTVGEVSEQFGKSRRTIARKIKTGELTPVMKLPGKTGSYLLSAAQVRALWGISGSSPQPSERED